VRLPRETRLATRIGLTPLIDVVFLLLVFFMLASTFLKFNYLPLTAAGEGAATPALADTLIVRVGAEGALDVNGEPVPTGALARRLDAWAERGARRAVLRVMPGAETGDLVGALAQARRSRLESLAVVR